MAAFNEAQWTRTKDGWQIIVTFNRHWEAPKVGSGKGGVVAAKVVKRGEYASRVKPSNLKLTSNVFTDRRTGLPKASAEET